MPAHDPTRDPRGDKDRTVITPGGKGSPRPGANPNQETADLDANHSAGAGSADGAFSSLRERYDMLEEAGRGGMGIVYRARDRETDEIVALKVLKPEIAARPEVIERFKAELRLARKITHKNVCRTYELLRFENTVAIAMEYVEGESLRSFLNRYGTVPFRRGLNWAGEICAALREAHAQGIVHRDLKPENIVIDRKSSVKVMDFGIARSTESEAAQTSTVIGTAAYMSPEQAEGKAPDARSDIYSLGLVLYEMFVGQRAFHADTPMAYALKHIQEPPPPPRSIEPYLTAFLDRAIQKCLEKDTRRRFQSVAELEDALAERECAEAAVAQPELPPRLAYGRRSDAALLTLGALGLAAFIVLAPQIIPEMGIRVGMTREMLYERARSEMTRRGWNPYPRTWLKMDEDTAPYYYLAEHAGHAEAMSRIAEEFPPFLYSVRYHQGGDLSANDEEMPGVVYEPGGAPRSMELPVAPWLPQGPGLPRAESLEVAKREMQQSFGIDTGQLTQESEGTLSEEGRHGYTFQWVKHESGGIDWHYQANIFDRPTLLKRWNTLPGSYRPPAATLWELIFMVGWGAFALMLFVWRRVYSGMRKRETIVLAGIAVVVGVGIGVAVPMPDILMFIFLIPFMCLFYVLYYILLGTTITFLAQRAWPHLTATYSALLQLKPGGRPVALALVRGSACGLILLGLNAALQRFGAGAHQGRVPLTSLYDLQMGSAFPLLSSLAAPLANAFGTAYGLGFFLSLVRRKTTRPLVLIVVGGLVTVAMEHIVLPPDWYQLFLAFLAGVAFSLVLIGFDLLAVIAAMFTFTVWQLAYPMSQIFESVGNFQYWLLICLWTGMLAWAAFAAFRPTWHRLGRRVAEALE